MKRLLIVGASGMGRETAEYAKECFPCTSWEHGFLDNRPELLDGLTDVMPPIVGTVEDFVPAPEDYFLIALGEPPVRRQYAKLIASRGGKFATLIHPLAVVLPSATIGEGSIICPQATVSSAVRLGRHTILNISASVSHDGQIGDFVTFSPGARTTGWCHVGDGAFLGTNAVVLPHVSVAKGCIVGACATITKDVLTPAVTLVGTPGKEYRKRTSHA